jgi:hypothetical protein
MQTKAAGNVTEYMAAAFNVVREIARVHASQLLPLTDQYVILSTVKAGFIVFIGGPERNNDE